MKKLLLLLLFLIIPNICFGEEIPPDGCGYRITKETNPIYWGYLEDYGAKLKTELEKSHMFRLRGMGVAYDFILTRNGEIKDMRLSIPLYEYFNKRIKKIILSVPPLPFRDGMNVDEMQFSVYLGYEKFDSIEVSIGSSFRYNRDIFHISVTTSK